MQTKASLEIPEKAKQIIDKKSAMIWHILPNFEKSVQSIKAIEYAKSKDKAIYGLVRKGVVIPHNIGSLFTKIIRYETESELLAEAKNIQEMYAIKK